MVRRIAAGAAGLVVAAGCQLAVSLDGYTGGASATGEGGPGASSSGTSGDGGSSGSSGSSGINNSSGSVVVTPLPEGVAPLTRSGESTDAAMTFKVDGRLSLGFTRKKSWQLVEWRNLSAGADADRDLGNSEIAMSEPVQVGYDGTWYGTHKSQEGTIEVLEESAARSTVRTTFVHKPKNGSVHKATTTYAIYADGRTVEAVDYGMVSGTLPDSEFLEFGHTNVSPETSWSISFIAGGAGFMFLRSDGGPECSLVAATHSAERGISNDDPKTNRFWIHDTRPPYTGKFQASWEYRFYGASSTPEREAWVQSVGVAIAQPSYDKASGAFVVDAKNARTASFALPAGATWTGPAFTIENWGGTTFRAELGGKAAPVIASRIGSRVIVLYAGTIAADAAARTFSFSAP